MLTALLLAVLWASGGPIALGADLQAVHGLADAAISVTTPYDELNSDGDCSLREAIHAANTDSRADACPAGSGSDIIQLRGQVYRLAIAGFLEDENATGDLDISSHVTLAGKGRARTIIDAQRIDRTIDIHGAPRVTIRALTLLGGNVEDASISDYTHGPGAGIRNDAGALRVVDAEISGDAFPPSTCGVCASGEAGGIMSFGGSVSIDRSSISGEAGAAGGAISVVDTDLLVTHSTLTGTAIYWSGGAIRGYRSSMVIEDSIIEDSESREQEASPTKVVAVSPSGVVSSVTTTVSGSSAQASWRSRTRPSAVTRRRPTTWVTANTAPAASSCTGPPSCVA
jgi:CSLREA domain-containing protein